LRTEPATGDHATAWASRRDRISRSAPSSLARTRTAVKHTGPKPVGFTAVRVRARLEGADRETLSRLLAHAVAWSPVAGSVRNPVPLDVRLV